MIATDLTPWSAGAHMEKKLPELYIFLRVHSNGFREHLLYTKVFAGVPEWETILEAFDLVQFIKDLLDMCMRCQRRYKRLKMQDSCPHGGNNVKYSLLLYQRGKVSIIS